jgi:hypothetical protein
VEASQTGTTRKKGERRSQGRSLLKEEEMKPCRKKIRVLVYATSFLFVPLAGMAMAQTKPPAPAPAVAPAAPAKAAEPAAKKAPAAPAKAAEPAAKKAPAKKAEIVMVTGVVEVVKSEKGKVVGHELKTDTETYTLKGKGIKAVLVGKKVEVTGTESTIKGKKVLTVKHVKEVPANWSGTHGPDEVPPGK